MRRKIRMVHGGYSIAGQIGQGPKRNHKKGFRPTYLKTIHNQLSAILNYAVSVIDKMRSDKLISLSGKGLAAKYVMFDRLSDN